MVLLRRLFDVAGGGPETDAFKHLAAAFTVLRALGTAATPANSSSSRIVSSRDSTLCNSNMPSIPCSIYLKRLNNREHILMEANKRERNIFTALTQRSVCWTVSTHFPFNLT